jgi:hypothetical protein
MGLSVAKGSCRNGERYGLWLAYKLEGKRIGLWYDDRY